MSPGDPIKSGNGSWLSQIYESRVKINEHYWSIFNYSCIFFASDVHRLRQKAVYVSFQVLWLSHKEISSLFLSTFFVFSIDATFCMSICKFVNDSPQSFANCQMRQFSLDGKSHLCLVAKTKITQRH